MRFFTGDESGLVKSVVLPPKSSDRPQKRSKAAEDDGEASKQQKVPVTQNFGKVDKSRAIQHMTWAPFNEQKHIVAARANGAIDYLSPETGEVVKTFEDTQAKSGFVGLYANATHITTCTTDGVLRHTPCADDALSDPVGQLGADLTVMRGNAHRQVAVGGQKKDLLVYDLERLQEAPKESKRKKEKPHGAIFQAKNVPNDFLNLEVPIHIRDLQFMNAEGNTIATATHYHQIRIYDTKAQRRPVHDWEVGKHPLTTLRVGGEHQLLYADTMSNVGMIDVRTGRVAAHFKGFSGAATDLVALGNHHVASVSLDRFLRVHEMTSTFRQLEHKVYLKQRLSCILYDEDYKHPDSEEVNEEEEEALWDGLEKVEKKKRKHASS